MGIRGFTATKSIPRLVVQFHLHLFHLLICGLIRSSTSCAHTSAHHPACWQVWASAPCSAWAVTSSRTRPPAPLAAPSPSVPPTRTRLLLVAFPDRHDTYLASYRTHTHTHTLDRTRSYVADAGGGDGEPIRPYAQAVPGGRAGGGGRRVFGVARLFGVRAGRASGRRRPALRQGDRQARGREDRTQAQRQGLTDSISCHRCGPDWSVGREMRGSGVEHCGHAFAGVQRSRTRNDALPFPPAKTKGGTLFLRAPTEHNTTTRDTSKMSSEAASDFGDMVTNFRRGMIPVVGTACLGVLLIVALLLHWKGQVRPPHTLCLRSSSSSYFLVRTYIFNDPHPSGSPKRFSSRLYSVWPSSCGGLSSCAPSARRYNARIITTYFKY